MALFKAACKATCKVFYIFWLSILFQKNLKPYSRPGPIKSDDRNESWRSWEIFIYSMSSSSNTADHESTRLFDLEVSSLVKSESIFNT